MQRYPDVDTYIASHPTSVRHLLEQMRNTILKAAPRAAEGISYGMPAYSLGTALVYFAAFKHHIGFYPTASGIREFKGELAEYKFSKGAVQFPLDKPLPLALVSRIVHVRLKQVAEQQAAQAAHKQHKAAKTTVKAASQQPVDPAAPFAMLSAPAQRALRMHNIETLQQLAKYSKADILAFHSIGPGSMACLHTLLAEAGLHFKA